MPQVNVVRDELFKSLGKNFTDEEFEDLCFEYGLEMEVGNGVEMAMDRLDGAGGKVDMSKNIVYKIEVPANRYDLLCLEGISAALRCYLSNDKLPRYVTSKPAKMEKITVKAATKDVHKLHQNICRRRTIASMGTHDYDAITGPITYEAQPPKDIVFKALKQTKEMNMIEYFEVLKTQKDQTLKKFLHIIEDKPLYPVFYDSKRTVLSLPPIINSDATKISVNTKNVLVEVTGTDLQKCKIVLNVLAAQFSQHCQGDNQFTVEPVEVVYEGREELNLVSPTLDYDTFEAEIEYICRLLGIPLDADQINKAALRMGLTPMESSDPAKIVKFEVAPIRGDILHACDIAEEIGIGYGFNNIPMVYPPTNTVGSFIPENKFTDLLRHELAQAGYIESLTCALVSIKENYTNLRYPANLDEAVQLSNPKTLEYELVRTSLIPGLMKTLHSNQKERIPQKIFEVSDTARISATTDTGAVNERKICIMMLNTSASFEVIHGALCLLMTKIGAVQGQDFNLREHTDPEQDRKYFPKRGADVMLEGKAIGTIGVLHPEVISNYELKNPVSVVELDFKPVWNFFKSH